MACGGIKSTLNYAPTTLVEGITNAKEIWDTLADKIRPQGENTLLSLIARLEQCVYGGEDTQNIKTYAQVFRQLDEDIVRVGAEFKLPDYFLALKWIHGLGPEFDAFVGNLFQNHSICRKGLSRTGALLLKEVITMAEDYEKLMENRKTTGANAPAGFFTHKRGYSQTNKQSCSMHPRAENHSDLDCWQQHPEKQPEWLERKRANQQGKRSRPGAAAANLAAETACPLALNQPPVNILYPRPWWRIPNSKRRLQAHLQRESPSHWTKDRWAL
ncbi:hypothetical protein VC83_00348 [Pseudogymnoascus destructans]|uniref:Uncharacterized protein n=1 Tax=Pseudogymnoascus destructans TaxID=655981 RepID=A0A177ANQ1_9PEZI|nr:uncharacterized protein VC83_00348 [Pseudogymnoascus destructans]OAF63470.1 hypothetical protein VC83_00348 [Pseudogymnoascus destructans]